MATIAQLMGLGVPGPWAALLAGGGGSSFTTSIVGAGPELISNTNFASSSAGWTLDPGATWSAGQIALADGSNGSTSVVIFTSVSLVAGTTYLLTVDQNTIGDELVVNFDNQTAKFTVPNGKLSTTFVANATAADHLNFDFTDYNNNATGTIRSVSLKPITSVQMPLTLTDNNANNLLVVGRDSQGNMGLGANVLKSITKGQGNVALGDDALMSITTGDSNTAIGFASQQYGTTGADNVSVGCSSLSQLTTGWSNVALGAWALHISTTANDCVAVGDHALGTNLTGSNNVGIGTEALSKATASDNVAVGYFAGAAFTTGTQNTAVGSNAGSLVGMAARTNCISIGYRAQSPSDNTAQIGNSSVTAMFVGSSPAILGDNSIVSGSSQKSKLITYDFTASFGAITGLTGTAVTQTVTGLLTTDQVHIACLSAPPSGYLPPNARVSLADTLSLYFNTPVGAGITLGSLNFRLTIIR